MVDPWPYGQWSLEEAQISVTYPPAFDETNFKPWHLRIFYREDRGRTRAGKAMKHGDVLMGFQQPNWGNQLGFMIHMVMLWGIFHRCCTAMVI